MSTGSTLNKVESTNKRGTGGEGGCAWCRQVVFTSLRDRVSHDRRQSSDRCRSSRVCVRRTVFCLWRSESRSGKLDKNVADISIINYNFLHAGCCMGSGLGVDSRLETCVARGSCMTVDAGRGFWGVWDLARAHASEVRSAGPDHVHIMPSYLPKHSSVKTRTRHTNCMHGPRRSRDP